MFDWIIPFIAVLGLLVFVHELGHFIAAKRSGIKVEKFSLGFPPNIFKKKFLPFPGIGSPEILFTTGFSTITPSVLNLSAESLDSQNKGPAINRSTKFTRSCFACFLNR